MIGRLMLAGTGSGCGKTSVTCAIIGAMLKKKHKLSLFKCGPDYIDPMFHKEILGQPSRNLDTFLCGENAVKQLFVRNTPRDAIAVIEGVMGFYDGMGETEQYSTFALSQLLQTPVVLVVNARGMALSMAAQIKGYLDFMPNSIQGIILNRSSAKMYPRQKNMIEQHCKVPVLGFLPDIPQAALESRHLGLVTAAEIGDLQQKMALLADAAVTNIDMDALIDLSTAAEKLEIITDTIPKVAQDIRIAVARDKAFCFYYQDNLDLLQEMGAELALFSPLHDAALPADIDGLLLGGGYPELYAGTLSGNRCLLQSIYQAVTDGLPTIAECGGFMTLCDSIEVAGTRYPMAGAIPTNCRMTKGLSRFGYQELTAGEDNLLCSKGRKIHAHEFHYSVAENAGAAFRASKPGGDLTWHSIFANKTLFAGYPHIHYWGNFNLPIHFLQACTAYHRRKKA